MIVINFIQCVLFMLLLTFINGFFLTVKIRNRAVRIIQALSFDFDDILSEDDIKDTQRKFDELRKVFPMLSNLELQMIVKRSPLLVTIETTKLANAVKQLESHFPSISPSYVLRQRSAGIELLMLLQSYNSSTSTGVNDIAKLLQIPATDPKLHQFLYHVPQALLPRYQLYLEDYCITMHELFQFTHNKSISLVERWPGILNINLRAHITRLKNSLNRCGLDPDDTLLRKLINNNPKVLIYDIPKRIRNLQRYFPAFDLYSIIRSYPKIITQSISSLQYKTKQYEALYGSVVDINKIISTIPTILNRNPDTFHLELQDILVELPSCSMKDLLIRAGHLLVGGVGVSGAGGKEFVPLPLIKRRLQLLRKAINDISYLNIDTIQDDVEDGEKNSKIKKQSKSKSKSKMITVEDISLSSTTTTIQTTDNNNNNNNDHIYTVIGGESSMNNILGNENDINIDLLNEYITKYDITTLNSHPLLTGRSTTTTTTNNNNNNNNLILNSNTNTNFELNEQLFDNHNDMWKLWDPVSDLDEMLKTLNDDDDDDDDDDTNSDSVTEFTTTTTTTKDSTGLVPSLEKDSLALKKMVGSDSSSANLLETSLDITRIVLEYSDLIVGNFPLLIKRLRSWSQEFGPSLSYSILSNAPTLLVKKPSSLSPTIKLLYFWAASLPTHLQQPTPSHVLCLQDIATTEPPSIVHKRLRNAIQRSPNIVLESPLELQQSLEHICHIFQVDSTAGKEMVMLSSRLLTDKKEQLEMKAVLLGIALREIEDIINNNSNNYNNDLLLRSTSSSSSKVYEKSILSSASNKESIITSSKVSQNVSQDWGHQEVIRLFEITPAILSSPLCMAARIFFAYSVLSKKMGVESNTTFTSIENNDNNTMTSIDYNYSTMASFLACNTIEFLTTLHKKVTLNESTRTHNIKSTDEFFQSTKEIAEEDVNSFQTLSLAYIWFLRNCSTNLVIGENYHRKLTSVSVNDELMVNDVETEERAHCTLLNEIMKLNLEQLLVIPQPKLSSQVYSGANDNRKNSNSNSKEYVPRQKHPSSQVIEPRPLLASSNPGEWCIPLANTIVTYYKEILLL